MLPTTFGKIEIIVIKTNLGGSRGMPPRILFQILGLNGANLDYLRSNMGFKYNSYKILFTTNEIAKNSQVKMYLIIMNFKIQERSYTQ